MPIIKYTIGQPENELSYVIHPFADSHDDINEHQTRHIKCNPSNEKMYHLEKEFIDIQNQLDTKTKNTSKSSSFKKQKIALENLQEYLVKLMEENQDKVEEIQQDQKEILKLLRRLE